MRVAVEFLRGDREFFVAQLDDESFGCFFTDAGNFAQFLDLVALNCAIEFGGGHVPNQAKSCFGSDAGDGDQMLEELFFFFGEKSVEYLSVFSYDEADV